MSLTIEGLFVEAAHGFAHRFDPLTICSYDVDVDDIVDLRTDRGQRDAGIAWEDLACPWALELAARKQPASWVLTKRLIASGIAGILVPSFASGARLDMHNLVLWSWGPDRPHRVVVYDPSSRLPIDQTSWRS